MTSKIKLLLLLISTILTLSFIFILVTPNWWFNGTLDDFKTWYPSLGYLLFYYYRYGLYTQTLLLFIFFTFLLLKYIRIKYKLKIQKSLRFLINSLVLIILTGVFFLFNHHYNSIRYSRFPKKIIISWKKKKQEIQDSLFYCKNLQDSIICINRFAYRDAIHGTNELHIDKADLNHTSKSWSSEVWYHYFSEDKMTVSCGGNADFNNSLYKEFIQGVKAYTYNISIPNDTKKRGHAITLLEVIIGNDKGKYYLVDPMFNTYFADKCGKLIDVKKMAFKYKHAEMGDVQIIHIAEQAQYLLTYYFETFINHPIFDKNKKSSISRSNNSHYPLIFNCERTLDNYLETYAPDFRFIASYYNRGDLIFKNQKDFVNCFAFVDSIDGIEKSDRLLKEIKNWLK